MENDFRPHYALEDFNTIFPGQPVNYLKLAIPMVSFCDIPLSQTAEHLSTYGCYGIGLTKEWGKRNGITPVLYTYPESLLAGFLRKMIKNTQKLEDQEREFLYDISRFVKPYTGPLWRAYGTKENVVFYNEREWRYIPTEHKLLLNEEDFLNEAERKKFNEDISSRYSIAFVPDDIRYLIVSTEDEILSLIKHFEKLKSKFGGEELTILTTRIITTERIREDF
ncbi:MAG: abortive infection system antitoxin AbiGi family protein [Deltaproteobacteria bacterium]|nr:abortive infection system antitoxin AbiGi family protein [Deltaproteobacteria bacterium]